jgi:hypothetical protein
VVRIHCGQERRTYGLEGLLPPAVDRASSGQVQRVLALTRMCETDDLERYYIWMGSPTGTETLFYRT